MKLNIINKAVLFIAAFCASVSVASAQALVRDVTVDHGAVGNDSFDNRQAIQEGINYVSSNGGGTLYFPAGLYRVYGTIYVKSNVRLQGTTSFNTSQIRLMVTGVPLFEVVPNEVGENRFNITFKDLHLYSFSRESTDTHPRQIALIRSDGTTGISLKAGGAGISNIVIDNVRTSRFTHGISATSSIIGGAPISDVKIRNFASDGNEYALYTNTRGADNWDVQNMNVYQMYDKQNGIFLEHSGKMKFLQLSCAGSILPPKPLKDFPGQYPGICAKLWDNGDTYFRNMHVEGPRLGFCVGSDCEPGSSVNSGVNDSLLTVENSAAAGEFHRRTNLVSINNRFWLDWAGLPRYRFFDTGRNSWVINCGDVWVSKPFHMSKTTVIPPPDAYDDPSNPDDGLATGVYGCMRDYIDPAPTALTFAKGVTIDNERLKGAEANVTTVTATAYGATADDLTDDTEAFRQAMAATSTIGYTTNRVFVPRGTYRISSTLELTGGMTFVGEAGSTGESVSTILLTGSNTSLFKVIATSDVVKGITLRNLVLTAESATTGTVGINLQNISPTVDPTVDPVAGGATDFQIQGVDFNNFTAGIVIQPDCGLEPNAPPICEKVDSGLNPMFDSVSLKNANFSGNKTAILLRSQNASNWNLENITVNIPDNTEGVRIDGVGLMSIRNLTCWGTGTGTGSACVTVQRQAGLSIQGLKATNVRRALIVRWENGWTQYPITLRDNDLTAGVDFQGRIFLNSINNTYPVDPSNNPLLKVVKVFHKGEGEGEPNSDNIAYGAQSDIFSCNDKFKDTSSGQIIQYNSWIAPIQVYTGTPLETLPKYCS